MPRKSPQLPAPLPSPSDKPAPTPRYKMTQTTANFAAWLAGYDKSPSKQQQVARLQALFDERDQALGLEPEPATWNKVRTMRNRADFKALEAKLREKGVDGAQELYMSHLPWYINLHQMAAAAAWSKGMLNLIPQFTAAPLRAVMPEAQATRQNVNVIIALSPARADLIDYERPVIEAEVEPLPAEEKDA